MRLGVQLGTLSPASANALHKPNLKGAHVVEVIKGSVADKCDILRDDVVVEYDGKPVTTHYDLLDAIAMTKPGQPKKIKVVRGAQELVLTAQF